ncbi:MAG: carboxypeptidase regulatory-like domain-containing protein [Candidatus Hadarchaeales archaeon]
MPKLTVTVQDVTTRKPIPGATVLVGGIRLVTDSAGRATVELPMGTYPLLVRVPNYSPFSVPIPLTRDMEFPVFLMRAIF